MKVAWKEVKQALFDERFRKTLPDSLQDEVSKFIKNPGCPCNMPLYRKILKECTPQLQDYFPGKEITNINEEVGQLAKNNWTVINCHISELEGHLKKLPPGRKQLDVARYEEQVTAVVNELDVIY